MSNSRESGSSRRVGLARTLSKLGYCSRSQAFALIREGRVALNGKLQRNPEFPVRKDDDVTVDGGPLIAFRKVYLVMNKPMGLVTTASDERGRVTVCSLLDPDLPWVAPGGFQHSPQDNQRRGKELVARFPPDRRPMTQRLHSHPIYLSRS